MISFPLVRYVLLASIRDRLIVSLLLILVLGSSLSLFLGSSAVVEKNFFTVVLAAGGLRISAVFGLVLFVVFFVRRSFESKDVDFLLSRPISRVQFLLSYSSAFSFLAIVMGGAVGLCVYGVSPSSFGEGHLLWVLSIIVENIIMVNVALFFSMYLSSAATSAMCVAGFYVLSRMMGQLLGIVDSVMVNDTGPLAVSLQVVSAVMPRLDLLGQTSWLLYGVEGGFGFTFVLMQAVAFGSLVLMAALVDLVLRQF